MATQTTEIGKDGKRRTVVHIKGLPGPKPHPTQNTVIKRGQIDMKMVPVVNWLNSLVGVTTLHCCQGEPGDDEKASQSPYVSFTCCNSLSLIVILRKIRCGAMMSLSWLDEGCVLIYCINFQNQQTLDDFIRDVKKYPDPLGVW